MAFINYKTVLGQVVFAKAENTYNGGPASPFNSSSVTLSDAIRFTGKHPMFALAYQYDGKRDVGPGTAGQSRQNIPAGRHTSAKITCETQVLGSAYTSSATTIPNQLAVFLAACGESASYTPLSTGSSQTSQAWSFSPTPVFASGSSAALSIFSEGSQYTVNGVQGTYKITADSAASPVFEFDIQGLMANVPVDVIVPPTTQYPTTYTVLPPLNVNINFAVGGISGFRVRKWAFEKGQSVVVQGDVNSQNALAGIRLARRAPKFTITVEATPFATYDPNATYASGTIAPLQLTIGNTAGNTFSFASNNAQLRACKVNEDGPVATWDLDYELVTSQPNSDDDYTLYWW